MVGFAAGGFLLARRPDPCDEIDTDQVDVSGNFGDQLINLMDVAIASRTFVGIIGSGHRGVGGAGLDGQPA